MARLQHLGASIGGGGLCQCNMPLGLSYPPNLKRFLGIGPEGCYWHECL